MRGGGGRTSHESKPVTQTRNSIQAFTRQVHATCPLAAPVLSSGLLISQLGNHAAWSPACFQFDSASPTRHAHARLKQAKQAKKSKQRK